MRLFCFGQKAPHVHPTKIKRLARIEATKRGCSIQQLPEQEKR